MKKLMKNNNLQKSFCRFEDTTDSIEAIMDFVTDDIAVGIDYSNMDIPILNLYKEGKLFISGKVGDYVVNDNGNFYVVKSID